MSCLMLSELPLSEQIAYELHHADLLAARTQAVLNRLDPAPQPAALPPVCSGRPPLSGVGSIFFPQQQDRA